MPNEDAAPIIIFIASIFGFAIVLLYVLARSWAQALSTRPGQRRKATQTPEIRWPAGDREASFGGRTNAMRVNARCDSDQYPDRRGGG